MMERLNRVVDGIEERLCWRVAVHGRADPAYEPADGDRGPYDPDRRRRLLRGETFQRLDRSGRPRIYQGLSWRPAGTIGAAGETPMPPVAVGETPTPEVAAGETPLVSLAPAYPETPQPPVTMALPTTPRTEPPEGAP